MRTKGWRGREDYEENYRSVIESASEAICITQDGLIRFFNPAGAKLTGHSEEDLLAKPFAALTHPDDLEDLVRIYQQRLRGEHVTPGHRFRIITAAGEVKWVESFSSSISWEERPAVLSMIRDVSKPVSAEGRLRLAWETSPDALTVTRLNDGTYVDINSGHTFLTGYEKDEVIGKSALDVPFWVSHADREKFVAALTQHGHIRNFQTKFRRKDGEMRAIMISAGLMMLDGEQHILAVTKDIEDLKRGRGGATGE